MLTARRFTSGRVAAKSRAPASLWSSQLDASYLARTPVFGLLHLLDIAEQVGIDNEVLGSDSNRGSGCED